MLLFSGGRGMFGLTISEYFGVSPHHGGESPGAYDEVSSHRGDQEAKWKQE